MNPWGLHTRSCGSLPEKYHPFLLKQIWCLTVQNQRYPRLLYTPQYPQGKKKNYHLSSQRKSGPTSALFTAISLSSHAGTVSKDGKRRAFRRNSYFFPSAYQEMWNSTEAGELPRCFLSPALSRPPKGRRPNERQQH